MPQSQHVPFGSYDLIVVGTGFASSFFLYQVLQKTGSRLRILVLERGRHESHADKVRNRLIWEQPYGVTSATRYQQAIRQYGIKDWVFELSLGGGSNCWSACTPRMLPGDFQLKQRYGIGRDWPIQYADLEPYYCDAEALMQVSGEQELPPFPMSRPYPQPAHRFNTVDALLARKFPGEYFHQPTARARVATAARPACCASSVCRLCPTDAKFTVLNELDAIFRAPNVTLAIGAHVLSFEFAGSSVTKVIFAMDGRHHAANCDQLALGANGIFNPHIMLNAGLQDKMLGRNPMEQASVAARIPLRNIKSLNGSTSITGNGYMLYDGDHRKTSAACLIEGANSPFAIRLERARYTALADFKFIFEDLPSATNRVIRSDDVRIPVVIFERYSDYLHRGVAHLRSRIGDLLSFLPVEGKIELGNTLSRSEGHILGTTVMGNAPADSVVDRNMVHHRLRNLLVLGGSAFPTASPANPSLTIAALSLRAADKAYS